MLQCEVVWEIGAELGEGPIWWKDSLYWVDINGPRLHIYTPTTGERKSFVLSQLTGTVVPRATGGVILAQESGLCAFDPETELDRCHFALARDIQGQIILSVGVIAASAGQAALGQLQWPAGGDSPGVQFDGGQLPVAYYDGHAAIHAGEKSCVAAVQGPSVTSIQQIQAVHLKTLRRRDQDASAGHRGTVRKRPNCSACSWPRPWQQLRVRSKPPFRVSRAAVFDHGRSGQQAGGFQESATMQRWHVGVLHQGMKDKGRTIAQEKPAAQGRTGQWVDIVFPLDEHRPRLNGGDHAGHDVVTALVEGVLPQQVSRLGGICSAREGLRFSPWACRFQSLGPR